MALEIECLSLHAQYLPQLARWHHQEWAALSPTASLDDRLKKLALHLQVEPFSQCLPVSQTFVEESAPRTFAEASVPRTFVALYRGDGKTELVGSASIVYYSLLSSDDKSPWLTNVYVHPKSRGQGVGGALVEYVERYARQAGFESLNLFTTDKASFYAQRHWQVLRQARLYNRSIDVMRLLLQDSLQESALQEG